MHSLLIKKIFLRIITSKNCDGCVTKKENLKQSTIQKPKLWIVVLNSK